GQDLVERVVVLELRVQVVHRMLVVLERDLRELLGRGAVLLHVLAARIAKNCAVGGEGVKARSDNMSSNCLSMGFVRSVNLAPSEPFSIFSNPSARTQSASPPSTNCLAMKSAVEPVEQLLFTL